MGDEEMEDVSQQRDLLRAPPGRLVQGLQKGPVVVGAPPDVAVRKNSPHRPKDNENRRCPRELSPAARVSLS
jgi:hypothetical protein